MKIKLLTFFADFIKTAAMGIARIYVYHGIVVFRCKFVLHQPGLMQYTDTFPIMDSSNFIASSLSVSNKIIEQIFSTGNSRYCCHLLVKIYHLCTLQIVHSSILIHYNSF